MERLNRIQQSLTHTSSTGSQQSYKLLQGQVTNRSFFTSKNVQKVGSARLPGLLVPMMAVGAVGTYFYYQQNLQQSQASDTSNHQVFAWGSANKGQLGLGTGKLNVNVPTMVTDLDGMDIKSLQCSSDRSAIINSYGELFTWGSAKNGAMVTAQGKAYPDNLNLPALFESQEHQFSSCALGRDHMAAITSNGSLIMMGSADHGKLGFTTEEKDSAKLKEARQNKITGTGYKPELVQQKASIGTLDASVFGGSKVQAVSCGFQHTVALTEDGSVWTWGHGKFGALGHGSNTDISEPKKVDQLQNVVQISAGSDYTMCLTSEGKVYAWGNNGYGQLGLSGNATKVLAPEQLFIPASVGKVVQISCGEEHSAYLDERGSAHTWGYGQDGQLGHGSKTSLNTARKIRLPEEAVQAGAKKVTKVGCGGGNTGLLLDTGDLYLMGRGRDGQIGRGDKLESVAMHQMSPIRVDYFNSKNLKVEDFNLGTNHTLAIVSPRANQKKK